MSDSIIIAISTCPDEQSAKAIAEGLVQERLATCVNRVSGMRSTYFWEGSLKDDTEILLIIKTTRERLGELEARLKALHPYDVPELVAIPVLGGNEAYLAWVRQGVEKDEHLDVSKQ